jgi:hypothetical protein
VKRRTFLKATPPSTNSLSKSIPRSEDAYKPLPREFGKPREFDKLKEMGKPRED